MVHEKGLFSFYRDGHKECCGIRKVEPLTRALESSRAWVTGQRKDQSPGTRSDVPVMQLDPTFGSADRPLVKFNPLSALDLAAGVDLHSRRSGPVQHAARSRLHLDRL